MRYNKIERFSVSNGPGIRVVLWTQGCDVQCKGCHNPQTWDFNGGYEWDEDSEKTLFKYLESPYISGITFSGGHPLAPSNLEEVLRLIKKIKIKFNKLDIWLYTGYILTYDDFIQDHIMSEVLSLCDVVVDGPFIEKLKDLRLTYCGSTNQRVIDVNSTLIEHKIVTL